MYTVAVTHMHVCIVQGSESAIVEQSLQNTHILIQILFPVSHVILHKIRPTASTKLTKHGKFFKFPATFIYLTIFKYERKILKMQYGHSPVK